MSGWVFGSLLACGVLVSQFQVRGRNQFCRANIAAIFRMAF